MVGRVPGRVTTQGTILSDLFAGDGYQVVSVSSARNPWVRLLEIVSTLVRERHRLQVVVLGIYCRRSFVVEDIASLLATAMGLPVVMVLRSGSLPAFMERFPGWSRRVLRRASVVVAPSPFLGRE